MTASKPEPLIDSVYARLRDLILSNVFRAGQKLVDRDLAEQLGVSRTPVREALGRLAMMGLVEARSRRGYYVTQYTAKQMTDLYEFRKILEVNAARLAAENAEPSHLREFERILIESEKLAANPTNHAKTVKLDLEIHDLASGDSEPDGQGDVLYLGGLGRCGDCRPSLDRRRSPRASGNHRKNHCERRGGCRGTLGRTYRKCARRVGGDAKGSRRFTKCCSGGNSF